MCLLGWGVRDRETETDRERERQKEEKRFVNVCFELSTNHLKIRA